MFFLPAKPAKEARNEVLSHWMETVQEVQFRVSVFTIIKWFSFSFLLNRATAFSLACCKIFVMVVIEVCCWFSPLLREVFIWVLPFSLVLKNQHFQIPIRPGVRYCSGRTTRLQNSPYFCVLKYARAVKYKVWNEAENRDRDSGETLRTNGIQCVRKNMQVWYFTSNNFTHRVTISRTSVYKV